MFHQIQKPPSITVIIVSFNAAVCIERAILSVLNQNYAHVELILVDGGSTDGTVDIIKHYQDHISQYISEPDAGIYDAMNKGVQMANGDWVYFLGADDILVNCLHKVARCLKSSNTVYYGDVYLPQKNKVYAGKFKNHTLALKNINHQSIFYPIKVFDHYQYDLRYPVLADYDLNLRCWGERKFRFRYMPILVAIHNESGLSHQASDPQFNKLKPQLIDQYFKQKLFIFQKSVELRRFISYFLTALRKKA